MQSLSEKYHSFSKTSTYPHHKIQKGHRNYNQNYNFPKKEKKKRKNTHRVDEHTLWREKCGMIKDVMEMYNGWDGWLQGIVERTRAGVERCEIIEKENEFIVSMRCDFNVLEVEETVDSTRTEYYISHHIYSVCGVFLKLK